MIQDLERWRSQVYYLIEYFTLLFSLVWATEVLGQGEVRERQERATDRSPASVVSQSSLSSPVSLVPEWQKNPKAFEPFIQPGTEEFDASEIRPLSFGRTPSQSGKASIEVLSPTVGRHFYF